MYVLRHLCSVCYLCYGVALVSRIDEMIGLFCKRALQKRQYSAKETYNFIDPTNRSHPICIYVAFTCYVCYMLCMFFMLCLFRIHVAFTCCVCLHEVYMWPLRTHIYNEYIAKMTKSEVSSHGKHVYILHIHVALYIFIYVACRCVYIHSCCYI